MVEIAVEKTTIIVNVELVNVQTLLSKEVDHPQHVLIVVSFLNLKATIIVMIRTTLQDVNGMVEIAVVIMSTQNTALLVYAQIPMHKEVEVLHHHLIVDLLIASPLTFSFFASSLQDPNLLLEIYFNLSIIQPIVVLLIFQFSTTQIVCIFTPSLHQYYLNKECAQKEEL